MMLRYDLVEVRHATEVYENKKDPHLPPEAELPPE